MRELNVAVVDTVTAHLFANVTDCHTRHVVEGVGVTELDHKRLDTVVFAVDNQASKHSTVRGRMSSTTNPPLSGTKFWSMDDKLVRITVERSRRLDTLNITTVRKFGHTKAAIKVVAGKHPLAGPVCQLTRRRTRDNTVAEQPQVHAETRPEPRVKDRDQLKALAKSSHVLLLEPVNNVTNLDKRADTKLILREIVNVIVKKCRNPLKLLHDPTLVLETLLRAM